MIFIPVYIEESIILCWFKSPLSLLIYCTPTICDVYFADSFQLFSMTLTPHIPSSKSHAYFSLLGHPQVRGLT
jgi:hypothetical protein